MRVYGEATRARTFLRNWVKSRIKFSLVPTAIKSSRVHGEKRLGKFFDATFVTYLRVPFYCIRANITVAAGVPLFLSVFLFAIQTHTCTYIHAEKERVREREIRGKIAIILQKSVARDKMRFRNGRELNVPIFRGTPESLFIEGKKEFFSPSLSRSLC